MTTPRGRPAPTCGGRRPRAFPRAPRPSTRSTSRAPRSRCVRDYRRDSTDDDRGCHERTRGRCFCDRTAGCSRVRRVGLLTDRSGELYSAFCRRCHGPITLTPFLPRARPPTELHRNVQPHEPRAVPRLHERRGHRGAAVARRCGVPTRRARLRRFPVCWRRRIVLID